MLTTKAQMQTEKASGNHIYLCSNNAPLPEVYEALTEFRTYVFGRMKEIEEQQKAVCDNATVKSEGVDGNQQ